MNIQLDQTDAKTLAMRVFPFTSLFDVFGALDEDDVGDVDGSGVWNRLGGGGLNDPLAPIDEEEEKTLPKCCRVTGWVFVSLLAVVGTLFLIVGICMVGQGESSSSSARPQQAAAAVPPVVDSEEVSSQVSTMPESSTGGPTGTFATPAEVKDPFLKPTGTRIDAAGNIVRPRRP